MRNKFNIVILLVLTGLFFSCRKNGTSWDSNWSVPIAYGNLGLDDMIQDSIFAVNPDSTLNLIFKEKIVDIEFDSLFKIPDTTIVEKIALAIDLDVAPGSSFINQIDERQFDIENAEIKELGIKSGGAQIKIENPIETGVFLTITLPGVTKDGTDLSVTSFVGEGTNANPTEFELYVDFSGYFMDLRGSDGNSWNTLVSVFDVQSDPNGDSVFVTNQDSIAISVSFQDVIPDYAKGYFGNRLISAKDTIQLDFMNNFVAGSLLIDSVNMDLNIINGLSIIATGLVNQLNSINSRTNSNINLNHSIIGQNININPASGSWNSLSPFIYSIPIHSGNSNIQSFIENLPNQLILDYDIEINPLGNISGGNDVFYPLSELSVEVDLNMPSRFSTNHLKFVDTVDFNIDQNPEGTRILNGNLKLLADNYFPFDLDVELIFLDEQGFPIDTLFSDGLLQAGLPNISGKVLTPTFSEINYLVDQNFMQVIEQANRIIIWADLHSPDYPLSYDLYDYYNIDFKIRSNIGLRVEF